MRYIFITASILAASVALQSAAFATDISIENIGTISGDATRNVIGSTQERVITEKISGNTNLNVFPIGSDDASRGHDASCDGDGVIKLSLTEDLVSGYIDTPLPDANLKDHIRAGEPPQGEPAQTLTHLFDDGESSWYYKNLSVNGSLKMFSDYWGARVDTYSGAIAFIGSKVTPTASKNFSGIASANVKLSFANINVYDASKFGEMRYLMNEKMDKYIAFGLDGNRKAYYSIDGVKTYIPDEYNWPDLDMNTGSKCITSFTINNVSTNGNTVSFEVTGQLKNNATIKWEDEFEVPDLQERLSDTEWVQGVVTNTCGHQLRFDSAIKLSYKTEIASQSFAAGFGEADAAGGESFGLSEEEYLKTNLKFDIKLSRPSLIDNLKMKLGYNSGNGNLDINGVWADGSLSLPENVSVSEDWQSVSIPVSEPGVTEAFDWEKVNLIGFSFNEKDDIKTEVDERIGAEIQIKNLRLEKETNCNAYADYIVYDKATKTQLSSFESKGGAEIAVAVSLKNEKDYDEEATYIAALYKDGLMADVKAFKVKAAADNPGAENYELFTLPSDISGYTMSIFPIKSLTFSKPYGMALEIK